MEVSQVIGVRENVLANTDCPWKSFQELRKVSMEERGRECEMGRESGKRGWIPKGREWREGGCGEYKGRQEE